MGRPNSYSAHVHYVDHNATVNSDHSDDNLSIEIKVYQESHLDDPLLAPTVVTSLVAII